ncbi:MAG: hypothetical protein NW237_00510 [Cyanobacteriota bacterium]|nr:hypothetical protein [Cyanobacteriota bacterium]
MIRILRVNELGELSVPAEVLGSVPPGTSYRLEIQGSSLILSPETTSECAQKAKRWREWAASHSPQPSQISTEALRREAIYE